MSVKSLVQDPSFDSLPPEEQQKVLAAVDPDFSRIGVNEVAPVVASIRQQGNSPGIGQMVEQGADVALSAVPSAQTLYRGLRDVVTNPVGVAESAPDIMGAAGSMAGPGGAALGGVLGQGYEKGAKKIMSRFGVPGADRPTTPRIPLTDIQIPSVPGVPKSISDVGVEAVKQGLLAAVPEAALKIMGSSARYVKNNPEKVGAAIDNYISAERGTGEVALKHPEITQSGYYNPERIRGFVNDVSNSIQDYKARVKNLWQTSVDFFDSKDNGVGRIGEPQVTRAVNELRDSLGIKESSGQYRPGRPGTPTTTMEKEPQRALGVPMGNEPKYSYDQGLAFDPRYENTVTPVGTSRSGAQSLSGQALEAYNRIAGKLNEIARPSSSGMGMPPERIKLSDAISLRQAADDLIDYGSDVPDALKNKFSSFRQRMDQIIGSKYREFKPADSLYSKMRNDVNTLKKNFGVREGKPAELMSDNEITQAEAAVRRVMKKGETTHEALKRIAPNLLERGKMLAASGGSAGRSKPFEQTLRPGLTFGKIAGGTGLLGSAYLAGSGHPLMSAAALAGSVATPLLTSPRMMGAVLRSAPGLAAYGRAMAPGLTPAILAALARRRQAQAQ